MNAVLARAKFVWEADELHESKSHSRNLGHALCFLLCGAGKSFARRASWRGMPCTSPCLEEELVDFFPGVLVQDGDGLGGDYIQVVV